MTAINPAKLKIQAAALGNTLAEPDLLIPRVHDLFSFYSSRIRHTSLAKTPLTLRTYQVPPPVLRALRLEFKARLETDPAQGFVICDRLWQERWVEFRQLAVYTLGVLPVSTPEGILSRIRSWLDDCRSEDIRRLTMTAGLARLAAENPALCLDFIDQLVAGGKKADLQAALFGLRRFVEDEQFINLPLIFKTLDRILRAKESGLSKEIAALLRMLAARSEQETAYFLISQLKEPSHPRLEKISRQLLGRFSPDYQSLIRGVWRKKS